MSQNKVLNVAVVGCGEVAQIAHVSPLCYALANSIDGQKLTFYK